jgi:hypothetical protein
MVKLTQDIVGMSPEDFRKWLDTLNPIQLELLLSYYKSILEQNIEKLINEILTKIEEEKWKEEI